MAHDGCNMIAVEQKYHRLRNELAPERYDVFLLLNVNDRQLLKSVPDVHDEKLKAAGIA